MLFLLIHIRIVVQASIDMRNLHVPASHFELLGASAVPASRPPRRRATFPPSSSMPYACAWMPGEIPEKPRGRVGFELPRGGGRSPIQCFLYI
ncbi:hypothetical protein RJ55_00631 [Drechmeria coniospora]|nr:hypothetical protein RJ55_00631 [Drechmeria coniospora]